MHLIANPDGQWPFTLPEYAAVPRDTATADQPWVEVSAQHADDLLGAVPPLYFAGGFAVGEAADSDPETGAARYFAVCKAGDKYWGRHVPRATMADAARELRERLW